MKPERWQQVRGVLHDAMQMDEAARSAFLDSQCATDPSLRAELNELLAAEDEVGSSFLEFPALAHAAVHTDNSATGTVLVVGTKLGPYVVQALIGAGGMGEVYRARDSRLDRIVAIKIIPASLSGDGARRQRFEREARAISALQHPNICTLYDVGQQDGIDYLVMEHLEGETLASRLARGRLTLEQVVTYGLEIADALDAAHRRGIIHRDLKPGNIFLTSHGECKVLDFGLAKLDEDSPDAPTIAQLDVLTSPGSAVGTVSYMSPEQARGEPLDARTDIFSLGAMLYEMATGRPAFPGKTSAVIFKAILDATPPPPSEVNKSLPKRLDEVIGKSLEKDRDLRYQSAAELRTDLKRLKRESESKSIGVTPSDRFPGARNWRRALWASLGLVAVLAVLWLLSSKLNPPAEPFQKIEITQVTRSGRVTAAAISPNGKYVAYADYAVGNEWNESVWIRQLAGGDLQIIKPSAVRYAELTFSPDGDFVYALREEAANPGTWVLYKVPVLGGNLSQLAGGVEDSATLSPDGKQLAFIRHSPGKHQSSLVVAKEDGREEREVAVRRDPDGFKLVAWSSGGTTIAAIVVRYDAGERYDQLVEVPIGGGSERHIGSDRWRSTYGLTCTSDGKGLLVLAQDNPGGPHEVVYVSRKTGMARKTTTGLNDYYVGLSITADSRSLATVLSVASNDLWVGQLGIPNSFHPITTGGVSAWGTWTRDGKVVYGNYAGGASAWIMEADGSGARQLAPTTPFNISRFRVSPNGEYIVFNSWKTGSPHIWRMNLDGSNPRQLTNSPDDANYGADWSPDSKWVIYSKWETEVGLWKIAIDGGDPVRLSDKPAAYPVISPDGTMVAYIEGSDVGPRYKVAIAPLAGGAPIIRLDMAGSSPVRRWTPDSHALLYVSSESGVSNIWSQPIDGGKPKQITNFNSDEIFSFDLSPDGTRIVLSRERSNSDAVVIRDVQ